MVLLVVNNVKKNKYIFLMCCHWYTAPGGFWGLPLYTMPRWHWDSWGSRGWNFGPLKICIPIVRTFHYVIMIFGLTLKGRQFFVSRHYMYWELWIKKRLVPAVWHSSDAISGQSGAQLQLIKSASYSVILNPIFRNLLKQKARKSKSKHFFGKKYKIK